MDKDTFIPNSYQTPNAYCDRLMYLLTPSEWKVLSYAVRRIFGFQKRQDNISLSQFVHGTLSTIDGEHLDHGTGLSKPTVITSLDNLMHFRLITKLAENNPLKNDGDLYALQLDYDLVDYAGLIERANAKANADLQRTAQGRNSAEQKRLSLPLGLAGQSDLPGGVVNGIDRVVVNGIDRGWSMGLTGGGQTDRPGVVNGIDTQYTVGKPEETKQERISLPEFDRACAFLKETSPGDLAAAAPILLEVNEHPSRLRIKLAAVPAGFLDSFKSALHQASRKTYSVSFETPGTGHEHPRPEQAQRAGGQGVLAPDASVTRPLPGHGDMTPKMVWTAAQGELQLEMTRATYETWVKRTELLSVNGTWKIGAPDKLAQEWLQNRLLSTVRRVLNGIVGAPVTVEFVVMGK
jgi:hypothetical protein